MDDRILSIVLIALCAYAIQVVWVFQANQKTTIRIAYLLVITIVTVVSMILVLDFL